ncbi:ArsR/SmtB family transcription factor [Mycobacteroides abscessus]|uniref:ArsR/SmtB family transcription factor n=1 Tax=Mycobacteroides abscessus TaxID=36809 RepID=UPI00092A6E75|nr:metalloregulator ArsR/SmtB family transcription factor [Mycobacteroides abscessus]SIJ79848.1 Putative transcriptional regulator, ArsR family [Mycobacteroides abscessus subsp. abscessus]SLE90480.1 Putative transcriptional regulator, ArsR family [Mycobacteroides abscessus subsp. abscessus]
MSNQLVIEPVNIRCSPLVREPISAGQAVDLAKVFKALGDPVRLRLFSLIASHAGGEACVCDISPGIEVSQPTISHHLKVLRNAGLLVSERRASWVYYQVVPEVLDALAGIVRIPDTTISATPTEGPS